jgi:hypothetical protein
VASRISASCFSILSTFARELSRLALVSLGCASIWWRDVLRRAFAASRLALAESSATSAVSTASALCRFWSSTVSWLCWIRASAELMSAMAWSTWSWVSVGSIRAIFWPLVTREPTSTRSSSTRPPALDLMSMIAHGFSVPVAETVFLTIPISALAILYWVFSAGLAAPILLLA